MRTLFVIAVALAGLGTAYSAPQLLGGLMKGIGNVGQSIVDTSTSAVKGAVQLGVDTTKGAVKLGLDTTKGAVKGVETIGEKSIEGAATIGKNVLGLFGKAGGSLTEGGKAAVAAGVDAGSKAVSLTGTIGSTAADAANKLAEMTSEAVKDGALLGTAFAQGWLMQILDLLRQTLSVFFS